MAVRTDVSVDYTVSPRIATVASPSTTITIQDLYDTLADIHTKPWRMMEKILMKAAGKDDLGGGKRVGITLVLQNARLAFAARSGPAYIQCTVTDGNVVAVDANNATINEIEPTAFTQVVVEKSTSPSIAASDAAAIADAVLDEALSEHTIAGTMGAAATDGASAEIPRGQALSNFVFVMVDASNHVTPKAGLTVSGQIMKDGGSWASISGSISDKGNGVYAVDQLSASEMDAVVVALRFTASGADTQIVSLLTRP